MNRKNGSKVHDGLLRSNGGRKTIQKSKTMEQMGNAVIYTRVSTSEQAENKQSLDSQEKACREFAVHRDIAVVAVFREEGESAKTADRTRLLEMIRYCQQNKGKVKYVIVWKVDRFARRAEDHLTLKALLMKLGIQLLSATEPIENSNTGKLMETMLAGFAEFDNGVRSERSAGGMKARLEEGGWVHLAPIGYRNIKDPLMRPTLEPDSMAPNVQKLLKEFAKGLYNKKQAVTLAHEYGIRTKKDKLISANGVYKMLNNPIYAGIVSGKMLKEPVAGLHPGLISAIEHQAIMGFLEGRKKSFKPEARGKPKWPLRQFMMCSSCGYGVTASTSRGRSKTYDYYHCAHCKGGVRVSRNVVHAEFEALLEKVKPSSRSLRLLKEITLRRWDKEFKSIQDERRRIDEEVRLYENRRQSVIERNLDGRMDDDVMSEQIQHINVRKSELVVRRAELYEGELEKEAIVDIAVIFMGNAAKLWREASLEDRQRFQKMIYPDGIIYFSKGGFGTALMGLCYEEIKLIEAEKQKKAADSATASDQNNTMVTPRGIEPRLAG